MADGEFSTNVGNGGEEVELSFAEGGDIGIDGGEPALKPKSAKVGTSKFNFKRILIAIILIAMGGASFVLSGVIGSGDHITSISPATINAENNNKLIYVNGTVDKNDLQDPIFNVSTTGLGLLRIVEMYQWAKENGQYAKKWSEELIELSDKDSKSKGFLNPSELPFSSEKWLTEKVKLGKFSISPELAKQIEIAQPVLLTEDDFKKLHPEGQLAFKLANGGYFFGINPEKPNIGDLRITFKSYPVTSVSIVGKQTGDVLVPYVGKNGAIGIIRPGVIDVNTITKGINLGGSSVVVTVLHAVSLILVILGLVIAIGKNPLSRKHKPIKTSQKPHKAEKAKKGTTSIQDVELEEEEEYPEINKSSVDTKSNHFSHAATDDFMMEDAALHSNADLHATPLPSTPNKLEPKKEQTAPPNKITEAPTPLEFTSANSIVDSISEPTILNQFGIDNEATSASISHATNTYTENSSTSTSYEGNMYDTAPEEEMPIEVEVLSDDMASEEEEVNLPAQTHNEILATIVDEVAPIDLPPPYHEPDATDDLMQIPDGVEIISDDQDILEVQNSTDIPKLPEDSATTAIDFYPEHTQENLPPPVTETTQVANKSLILPPPPDFSSIFEKTAIKTDVRTEENKNIMPENAITENAAPQAETSARPHTPDFDSLFSEVKASKPITAPKATDLTFDLPSVPDNFDPSVEMPAPDHLPEPVAATEDFVEADSDIYSPFGDGIDDPFATPEDEKK